MKETVRVRVGVVGKAHGIRGEAHIDVRTDEPERRFAEGKLLRLADGRSVRIAGARRHTGKWLVSFEGYGDRTSVESLRGQVLYADVAATETPKGADEFFDRHLIGLTVRDAQGRERGVVVRVWHLPAQDLLVVNAAGQERFVPFVNQLVPVVDVAKGFIQLSDVAGLLEDE